MTATAQQQSLAAKVGRLSASPEEMLAAANKAVASLRGEFERWLAKDIAAMRQMLNAMTSEDARAAQARDQLRRQAHTTKGQGTTFGYDLITAIAGSLNHYLVEVTGERQRINIIRAHIEALDAVARSRMTGDGGAAGQALIATLADAITQQA
ncbi:MAG TPA: Hpt domain-containing protein [Micropepsaceae bacterium]|nr:Hpt domain-containing protein [Micropepsaceae bacterium]